MIINVRKKYTIAALNPLAIPWRIVAVSQAIIMIIIQKSSILPGWIVKLILKKYQLPKKPDTIPEIIDNTTKIKNKQTFIIIGCPAIRLCNSGCKYSWDKRQP
ncbi:hypothetical protein [Calothrix sp. NIES-2098]|uniref:hypothetical protein n=1 Tax=Calothrix sp. NIES-2098 TaxID=1954171 RepID=UPI0030DC2042